MSCAFCGNPGPLSREHIWPRWLHKANDRPLKYHAVPDKVFASEQVVKDVCTNCNNGSLSELDQHGRSLHERYFRRPYQTIKDAVFEYDFEKTMKWLLKISYNSARAARSPDADLLGLYAPYIISPGCSPVFAAVSISLLGQLIAIQRGTGTTKVAELTWCRTGPVSLSAEQSAVMSVRIIMIHSWRFMLVVMKDAALKRDHSDVVLSMLHGAVLRPDRTQINVPTIPLEPTGVLQHFKDKEHLYRTAYDRRRP
jgi:hypothetical protein